MTPKKVEATKPKEDVKPQPATPAAQTTKPEPQPSKQQMTIGKLKQAWTEKGVDLAKLTEKQDGKFILLQPTPEWPIIRVGPTGGLELPQVRSFAKAWDAAVNGLAVWQKQQQRDAKKQAAASTKPSTPAPAAQTKKESSKAETPTQRKQKQDAEVERQLQHA